MKISPHFTFTNSLFTQAMAIFGHMNANSPIKGGSSPSSSSKGTPTGPATKDSTASEVVDESDLSMKDLEATMEELSRSIDHLTAESSSNVAAEAKEKGPPHFTVATSPTRHSGDRHDH